MPAIPPPYQTIQQPNLVNTGMIQQAGQSMREIAQTSQEVGQAMVKLRMAQQEANDATWLTSATARAEKDITTQFDEFSKANADNPDGAAEKFQKQVGDYFSSIYAEAPSTRARNLFQQQARQMGSTAYDNAFKWQNQQMVKNFTNRLDQVQLDLSTVAMRANSPAALQGVYKQVDAATVAGATFIAPSELDKLNRNMKSAVAQSYLERAVSTSPGSAMKSIDGKAFDGVIEPDKLMAYRRSAHAEIKRQEAEARQQQFMERAQAMEEMKGALEALNQGQNVDVSKLNYGALPENKRELFKQAIADAQDFSAVYNQVRFDSPADMQATITAAREKLSTTPPSEYRREAKQVQMLEQAVNQRTAALNKDPYSYVSQAPAIQQIAQQMATAPADQQPAMQQKFASTMVAEQQRLGVPYQNISLMPQSVAQGLVSSLSNPTMPTEQVVGTIQSLHQTYGQYYPYVQQQLTKAGLPTHLEVVAARAQTNPALGQKLMQAVQNQKALADLVPSKDKNEIDATIASAMQPLAVTLRQNPNGATKLQSYANTAKLLAMQYVADGADKDEAASRAASEVVMNEYSFENTYRVPAAMNAYSGDIRAAANRRLVDIAKKGEFDIPRTSAADLDVARRLANEDLKGQAYWITTADDQGLMLYHPQRGPVTYNRKPIVVPFADMVRMQQEYKAKRNKEIGGPNALGMYN